MKKKTFKTNKEYFTFINKNKARIIVYKVDFTKTMQIHLFYDIIKS